MVTEGAAGEKTVWKTVRYVPYKMLRKRWQKLILDGMEKAVRIMNNDIVLRKANNEDLQTIIDIYKDAIRVMESNGIYQWDSIYPNEEIINKDIIKNQMFLGIFGDEIASVFVLNQDYDKEYVRGDWQYNDVTFFVIHRLCVNPAYQGKGIGTVTMLLIEEFLRNNGVDAIRLDAYSLNPVALKMYEKLNYKKVGEVNWRKGLFYLYEKKI